MPMKSGGPYFDQIINSRTQRYPWEGGKLKQFRKLPLDGSGNLIESIERTLRTRGLEQ